MLMNLLGKLYLKMFAFAGGGVLLGPSSEETSETSQTVKELEDKIYTPMDTLIQVLTYGMEAVGVIICIKAIVDFVAAYPQHDSTAMIGAVKWLVSGIILGSIGLLIQLFRK